MKLKTFYQKAIQKGVEADIRSKTDIESLLKEKKKAYNKLNEKDKRFFDEDSLFNPFADTRILNGDPDVDIKSIIVGVDVEGPELLAVDRLKDKGVSIDLAVAHHPEGKAFAGFHNVMDLQVDAFVKYGISISAAENLLGARKEQVARRVHAANHQRGVDIAKLLKINYMCLHTPADNCAYQHMTKLVEKSKPKTIGAIMNLFYSIGEYVDAAKNNNAPKIAIGSENSKASNILFEFTGGTEGPQGIYEKFAASGIDTIVAMHQSEEHYKKCKQANINVIFASHIASDNLGINLILDSIIGKEKIKVHECSGFRRIKRSK
ncbi:MAG: NGG1p interacting factor NIF3 [Candidatus Omnitrophica bacterium]|nr:NGG1p interacting factor NIF3 [Candidatus Omnitrophota bacterium]